MGYKSPHFPDIELGVSDDRSAIGVTDCRRRPAIIPQERQRGVAWPILLMVLFATQTLVSHLQSETSKPQPLRGVSAAPNIYPGDRIEKVKQMFGSDAGMQQQRDELRYFQWWRPDMSVEIWTDQGDTILSVKIRFKNVPIKTPDTIVLGRDSLHTAEAKLGDRFLGESSSVYVVELDCQGYYIGAKSNESSKWNVNYESIICRKGSISEDELVRAPINNMSRQVNGFTEPK